MSCSQQRRAGEGRWGSRRHLEDSRGVCGTGGSTGVNGTLTALRVTAVRAGRSGRHLQRLQAWQEHYRSIQITAFCGQIHEIDLYIAVWPLYFFYYSESFFFSNNNTHFEWLYYWNNFNYFVLLLKCNYLKVKSIFHTFWGNYVVFSSQIKKINYLND